MDNYQYWHELLPLYLEGRLSEQERVALEQQLEQDPNLRHAYDEWRLLAAIVREESKQWGLNPPPLSVDFKARLAPKSGRNQQTQPSQAISQQALSEPTRITSEPTTVAPMPTMTTRTDGYEPTQIAELYDRQSGKSKRNNRTSLSLAAAAVLMILFSGFIVFVLTNSNEDSPQTLSQINDASTASPTITPFDGAVNQPTALPTNTLPVTAISTENEPDTPDIPNPPTTDDTSSMTGIGGANPPASATPFATPELAVPESQCIATTPALQNVTVYSTPFGPPIERVMQPGEIWSVIVVTTDGWYEVVSPDFDGTWGWVPGSDIQLLGDCSRIPAPSPTITISPESPPIATPTHVPEVGYFEPSSTQISPGDTITLSWSVRNASAIWIEYISGDLVNQDPTTVEPDEIFDNLAEEGSLEITIPFDYSASSIQFSLIIDQYEWSYENGSPTRGPSVSIFVPIVQSTE